MTNKNEIDFTGPDDESNPDYMRYIDQHMYLIYEGGCHIWLGRSNKGSYTAGIYYKDKYTLLSRLIYKWCTGESLPTGKTIKMTCHNTLCCNYNHMSLAESMSNETYERYKSAGLYVSESARQRDPDQKISYAALLSQ